MGLRLGRWETLSATLAVTLHPERVKVTDEPTIYRSLPLGRSANGGTSEADVQSEMTYLAEGHTSSVTNNH